MSGRIGVAAFLLAGLIGCHSADVEDDDEAVFAPSNVEAATQRLMAADNSADLAALLDCYTPDALLLAPDGSTYTGRDAIRSHMVEVFAKQSLHLKATTAETSVGDQGWAWQRGEVTGTITPKDGSAVRAAHDRYLMILELGEEDDHWRIARLIWTPAESR